MPKINNVRITPETGELSFKHPEITELLDLQVVYEEVQVYGRNIGDGHGLFAGASHTNPVLMDFRSIVAGDGIEIQGDAYTITVSSPTNATLPDIGLLPGVATVPQGGTGRSSLTKDGILIGNNQNAVQQIVKPVVDGQFLTFNNGMYEWKLPDASVTPIKYEVTSSDRAIVVETTSRVESVLYNLKINRSEIDLKDLSGILPADKGGTGLNRLRSGSLLVGNGVTSWSLLDMPTNAGNYVLTTNGTNVAWSRQGTFTGFTASTSSQYLTVTPLINATTNNLNIDFDHRAIPINSFTGTLAVEKGGTGFTTVGTQGQFLRSNGNSLVFETVVVGDGTVKSVELVSDTPVITVVGNPITSMGVYSLGFDASKIAITDISGILPISKGGTGRATLGAPNSIMKVNAAGNAFEYATIDQLGFSDVAVSGSYTDLINQPTLSNVATSGEYDDLINKPVFADIAISGDWNDLKNKPNVGLGSVTSVGLGSNTSALTITDSPVTDSGTIMIDLDATQISINDLTGVLNTSNGGTGFSTYYNNNLLIGNSQGSLSQLAPPEDQGKVLLFDGTNITWGDSNDALPTATVTDLGMVRVGFGLGVDNGTIFNTLTDTGDLTNQAGYIKRGDLATVATTGEYTDLHNRPKIATADKLGLVSIGDTLEIHPDTGVLNVKDGAGGGKVIYNSYSELDASTATGRNFVHISGNAPVKDKLFMVVKSSDPSTTPTDGGKEILTSDYSDLIKSENGSRYIGVEYGSANKPVITLDRVLSANTGWYYNLEDALSHGNTKVEWANSTIENPTIMSRFHDGNLRSSVSNALLPTRKTIDIMDSVNSIKPQYVTAPIYNTNIHCVFGESFAYYSSDTGKTHELNIVKRNEDGAYETITNDVRTIVTYVNGDINTEFDQNLVTKRVSLSGLDTGDMSDEVLIESVIYKENASDTTTKEAIIIYTFASDNSMIGSFIHMKNSIVSVKSIMLGTDVLLTKIASSTKYIGYAACNTAVQPTNTSSRNLMRFEMDRNTQQIGDLKYDVWKINSYVELMTTMRLDYQTSGFNTSRCKFVLIDNQPAWIHITFEKNEIITERIPTDLGGYIRYYIAVSKWNNKINKDGTFTKRITLSTTLISENTLYVKESGSDTNKVNTIISIKVPNRITYGESFPLIMKTRNSIFYEVLDMSYSKNMNKSLINHSLSVNRSEFYPTQGDTFIKSGNGYILTYCERANPTTGSTPALDHAVVVKKMFLSNDLTGIKHISMGENKQYGLSVINETNAKFETSNMKYASVSNNMYGGTSSIAMLVNSFGEVRNIRSVSALLDLPVGNYRAAIISLEMNGESQGGQYGGPLSSSIINVTTAGIDSYKFEFLGDTKSFIYENHLIVIFSCDSNGAVDSTRKFNVVPLSNDRPFMLNDSIGFVSAFEPKEIKTSEFGTPIVERTSIFDTYNTENKLQFFPISITHN